jgi:deazaflavin-dependent oxidoreductase (nitroreductase family)
MTWDSVAVQLSAMRKLGATAGFARVHKYLAGIDAKVYRATGGRVASAIPGTGLRQLLITTTGRKSGLPRTVTLVYFDADNDGYVVIGSNYGQQHPPAWSLNLLDNPKASITIRAKTMAVTARVAEGEERAACWANAVTVWPAYAAYEQRAGNRHINVFILEPHA